MWCVSALLLLLPSVYGATAPTFKPPSAGPLIPSPNYGQPSNFTLPKPKIVRGKAFDRFIQIWLENTDFATAASSQTFAKLAKQGITLSEYHAIQHPSEPNYIAAGGGDYFGMGDDDFYNIDANVSTIVDLLEEKKISWATYQESMFTDGDGAFSEALPNYLNTSAPPYTYYVRKHNPLIIYDSVANVPARRNLDRNFNDFVADIKASALPQWQFYTPNLVDDAHDTDIDFTSQWLEFFLVPLLKDERFNDDRTLILLTFDENESANINNRVFSLLLGGSIPKRLQGTTDSTFYTHYSTLSTVQSNWGLGCLGRGDTNKTMSNVFSFVADQTKYKNLNVTGDQVPLTNSSGQTPGPLNPEFYVPFPLPNTKAKCAGGGRVFVAKGLNLTIVPTPAPVNLTALNQSVPDSGPPNATAPPPGPLPPTKPAASNDTGTSPSGGAASASGGAASASGGAAPPSSGAGRETVCVVAAALGAILAMLELSV